MKKQLLLILASLLLMAGISACTPSRPALISEKLLQPLSPEERKELEASEHKILPYLDLKDELILQQKEVAANRRAASKTKEDAKTKLENQKDAIKAAISASKADKIEAAEKQRQEGIASKLTSELSSLEEAFALATFNLDQKTAKDEVILAEIELNKAEMALRIAENQELSATLAAKYQAKDTDEKQKIDVKSYEAYRQGLEKALEKSQRNVEAKKQVLATANQKLQGVRPAPVTTAVEAKKPTEVKAEETVPTVEQTTATKVAE